MNLIRVTACCFGLEAGALAMGVGVWHRADWLLGLGLCAAAAAVMGLAGAWPRVDDDCGD